MENLCAITLRSSCEIAISINNIIVANWLDTVEQFEDIRHTSKGQTWEYIIDAVDTEECKKRLKGDTMLADIA